MFPVRRLSVAILLLLATVLSHAVSKGEWVEVRSPNFSVVTDAGEKRGREVALRFEQMRHVFSQLILKDKVNIPVPLVVIAFRNSKQFRTHMPLWKGKPIKASGIFVGGDDRNFILVDLSAIDPWKVVFHEYGHLLLNGNFPRTQPWFDEGFAEYYSTLEVRSKDVEIGDAPEYAGHILTRERLFPIAELFSVREDSNVYNEGDPRHLFYAQSWLVVHYLFDSKKLPAAGTYFTLVNEGLPIAESVKRAFGMEPAQFDKEMKSYLHSPRMVRYTIPLETSIAAAKFSARELDALDAQAILAELHLHSRDHQERAIAEFQGILAERPEHPAAHRGLGYAYLSRGIFDKATEHFRRAAAQDSKDPRVHYFSALLMNRKAMDGPLSDGDAQQMKKHLEAAIALDAGYADAHFLLALAYDVLDDHELALAAIKRACELSPRNDMYALNLARAHMQARKWQEAASILKRLTDSKDPLVASNAGRYLEEVKQLEAGSPLSPVTRAASRTSTEQWDSGPSLDELDEPTPRPAGPAASLTGPVNFLRGTLINVDCSPAPAAVLTISAAGRNWRMLVRAAKGLIVIGADQLDCAWKDQKVSVNYRVGGKYDAELVSLEIR